LLVVLDVAQNSQNLRFSSRSLIQMPRPVPNPYNISKKLVRMSWDKMNLYNTITKKPTREGSNLRKTVYQQRWTAKRELRAYHVPNITEKQLLARHFTAKIKLQHLSKSEQERVPPVQALGFAELERRVDVVVFRSHFANSIFQARKMVVDGHVLVNGEKSITPSRRLNDGDMITVDPSKISTLSTPDPKLPGEFKPHPWMAPWMFTPAYLEVNYPTCSTVFLRSPLPQPDRVEVPSPLPPSLHQLCFEWYARKKRTKTATTIRAPIIIDGKVVRLKNKFDRMVRWDQNVERLIKLGKSIRVSKTKVKYTPRKVAKIEPKKKR